MENEIINWDETVDEEVCESKEAGEGTKLLYLLRPAFLLEMECSALGITQQSSF